MSKNEPRTDSILVIAKMCVKSSGFPNKYLTGTSIASWIITQKRNAKTVYETLSRKVCKLKSLRLEFFIT